MDNGKEVYDDEIIFFLAEILFNSENDMVWYGIISRFCFSSHYFRIIIPLNTRMNSILFCS